MSSNRKLRYAPSVGDAPSGTSQSRGNPIAWSIRTPPALRMHARSVARNGANPPFLQRARRERGDSPVLAPPIEQIGRRTDRQAVQNVVRPAPGMAAPPGPCRRRGRRSVRSASRPRRARCCASRSERSAIHCRNLWNSTSRRCESAKAATAGPCGSRRSVGQLRQSPRPGSRATCSSCNASKCACSVSNSPPSASNCAKSARSASETSASATNCANNARSNPSFAAVAAGQSISSVVPVAHIPPRRPPARRLRPPARRRTAAPVRHAAD